MGIMIDGEWTTDDDPGITGDGQFMRKPSVVRHRVGDAPEAEFETEPGRYRLYVHPGCPWAHRTLIARALLGLDEVIDMRMTAFVPSRDDGWVFDATGPHRCPDGRRALHELYRDGVDGYTGRATVPVLWDTKTGRMVNNESSDILRMFHTAFAPLARNPVDLRPPALADEIDRLNERIYVGLNNAVYRAGFAQEQAAHDEAVATVFDTLGWLEERLSDGRRHLFGEVLTETDIRTCTTLLRFGAYREVFFCDLVDESAHPHVWAYRDRMLALPAVSNTALPPAAYAKGYSSIPFAAANNPAIRKRRDRRAA